MNHYFPHEQLDVYGVALRFASLAEDLLTSWRSSWAVYGQFDRAIESVVTNLAKAARLSGTDAGVYSLECSLGSVLECAASLDVASLRNLVDRSRLHAAKELLQQIARMEVGLRRSWGRCVHEQPDTYAPSTGMYFLHESLRVYQRSLQVHEGLSGL